ncbi:uncharacterized protein LOC113327645 isoform X1 [Papaver somniferum]|uniref:uncharacterized protein LOC113327645 isoform X1 n=1 Tax=Papaver somniferum TaxID=3469 RepID=UPI000E6FA32F|nr:uncharacterized protein LOC113327645 isoform X1 [Papaver somniferum]
MCSSLRPVGLLNQQLKKNKTEDCAFHVKIQKEKRKALQVKTIPLKFVREHLLAEVTNPDGVLDVLLQNEEGLRWEVVVRPNGIDRYAFFKGWKNFATDNKLKIGDCVIFEPIDRLPDSTFAMNVHMRRISENFASAVAVESKVNSFNSPLPSFRISIKPSNMFGSNIPVKFAREHIPTKCWEERMDQVLLQNVEGRS